MVRHPRHVIRARQRSRTALPAFTEELRPAFQQVAVDRVQIVLQGTWRTTNTPPDALSAQEFRALLSTAPAQMSWFRSPESRRRELRLRTLANNSSTLSMVDMVVNGWPATRGNLVFRAAANPTRTLAHLLAQYGEEPDFLAAVSDLPVWSFFEATSEPVDTSFGSPDNWVEDYDLAQRCLGPDVFSAFLPLFSRKLIDLFAALASPRLSTTVTVDGSDLVLTESGIEVRLNCGAINVPQIECYFERHHSQAVPGVRQAVAAALVTLDYALATRYEQIASFGMEREDDKLSIAAKLARDRRLLIYAKSRTRLRFEIKRLKKGDYRSLAGPAGPFQRLTDIFDMERRDLLTACNWASVGALFAEPSQPTMSDLTRLCSLVAAACLAEGVEVEPVLARILEDGGASKSGGHLLPRSLVARLSVAGVLERSHLRSRDHRQTAKRVALTAEYRALIDNISHALVTSTS